VLADGSGRVSTILFDAATVGGARSLGINAGRIAPGCSADFATIDLTSPLLDGWTESTLSDLVIFGGSEELILRTCVDGVWSQHREPHRR
jgi:cytosine/adenosine deaminase-related metal-dependent hydrolase